MEDNEHQNALFHFLKRGCPWWGAIPGPLNFIYFPNFHHFTAEPQRLPPPLINLNNAVICNCNGVNGGNFLSKSERKKVVIQNVDLKIINQCVT
jgi:hypothetical protein